MQSKRFGVAWQLHQTLPRYAAPSIVQRDPAILEALALSANALGYIMPCRYCRDSYQQFRLLARANVQLQKPNPTQEDYEQYYFSVHNLVNAKLDKPIVSLDQKRRSYNAVVAKNAQQFRCNLLEWLAMLAMNYENVQPTPDLEKILPAAIRTITGSNGEWWLAALQQDKDLVDIVNEWADSLLTSAASQRFDDNARQRWRHLIWHVVYLDSVLRIAESPGAPRPVASCAASLRTQLSLIGSKEKEDCSGAAVEDALGTRERLFAALHAVKRQCIEPNKCESLLHWYTRIASYRANQCAKGTCK